MKKFVIILIIIITSISTNIYAYNYHISGNIENQLDCWVGWKKYHYGDVGVIAKKGDTFKAMGSPQIINGVFYEGQPYTVTTNGYGYYSLEFSKHVLGLLSFIKSNISSIGNYKTNYVPLPTTLVGFSPNEDGTVNLKDALSIAMNDMIATQYSSMYENNEFIRFWDATFLQSQSEKLKKIQNRFYWKAYGESAFNKLTEMMGSYYNNLNDNEKIALKGVLFSIMEARYRNKNVQGKMNLQVKAAEGELWPFLVNLKNLNHLTYDNNTNKYIDDRYNDTYYDWPDFDTLIEGAYQWMLYYDADIIRTTSHRTITSTANNNSNEEIEINVDWESEFSALTWEYLPALSEKQLEEFYSRCQQTKSLFKKSSENAQGIFGAEELYDITSTINFSEAIRDMKTAMVEFCGEGTMDSIWTGLTDYNIERTYLMAKNIVETNKVQDEFAYYNIGTNILTYTYGRHGKEYLLMDFQRVKLKGALKDKDDKWTDIDSDGDGISDRNELGDANSSGEDSMWAKVDITKFIKKSVEKELYGNDTDAINSKDGKLMVENALAQVKYNIYKERQQFLQDHPNDNLCDRKEDKENYLNIDAVTESKVNGKSDAEIISIMKNDSAKLQVRLWKYKSNPVLKDTDFDGLDDSIDKSAKDNHFVGRMNSTRIGGIDGLEVDMTMDYRYFFLSNKLYYDELSTMSLLYANSVYMQNSGISVYSDNNPSLSNLRVKELMNFYGFEGVQSYYMGSSIDDGYEAGDICKNYSDTHKGRVVLGYKIVEYQGLEKTVIGVVIRGSAEDDDWDSDFDMGDLKYKHGEDINKYDNRYNRELSHFTDGYDDWKWDYHHAGFDIVANRILRVINEYKSSIDRNIKGDICYWVTGHSMGGGVANLVGASLVSSSVIPEIRDLKGNSDNVYCYTYAAPNTFYLTDNHYERKSYAIPGQQVTGDYREPHGVRYRCIFNIVNEDDFVPEVPMKKCSWTKYGRTATISFNSNKYEIEKIVKNEDKYKTISYDRSVTKDYINNQYKGNTETIKNIVDSFNDIFEDDPEHMRYSAYEFNDNDYVISKRYYIDPKQVYTRPYQKAIYKNKTTANLQMPAFFMQVVANSMHSKDNNGNQVFEIPGIANLNQVDFLMTDLSKRYKPSQNSLVKASTYKLIENPHYLESYYFLTKLISIIDFDKKNGDYYE